MTKIKGLLDARYGLRPQRLQATVTAAPLVAGRSAGYVVATVGGVGGVRVNVSPDLRQPYTVGDTLVVEGTGTAAATEYWASGRIAGGRADSDIYQFPNGGTLGGTTLGTGDFVLGSSLADWSNWWYQFELGRWQIRKGTLMTGAIGGFERPLRLCDLRVRHGIWTVQRRSGQHHDRPDQRLPHSQLYHSGIPG